jgi:DNA polymerase-1
VFHNYSFDHHVIMNQVNPDVRAIVQHINTENHFGREAAVAAKRRQNFSIEGFTGDTMHMARLLEPSRMAEPLTSVERRLQEQAKKNVSEPGVPNNTQTPLVSSSLEMLNDDAGEENERYVMEDINEAEECAREAALELGFMPGYSLEALTRDFLRGHKDLMKKPMKQLFGVPKLKKDGSVSKTVLTPATHQLHGLGVAVYEGWQERWRLWVMYGVVDAVSTWHLYHKLKIALELKPWKPDPVAFAYDSSCTQNKKNLLHVYNDYLVPFGQLLAQIESRGFEINVEYLKQRLEQAERDRERHLQHFMSWLGGLMGNGPGGAADFNLSSDLHRRALLFGRDEVSESGARTYKNSGKPSHIGVPSSVSGSNQAAVTYLRGPGQELVVSIHKSKEELQLELHAKQTKHDDWVASYNTKLAAVPPDTLIHCKKFKIVQLIEMLHQQGLQEHLPYVKRKSDLIGLLCVRQAPVPAPVFSSVYRDVRIPCLGLKPVSITPTGFAQVNAVVLQAMVGKPDPQGLYTQGRAYAELIASGWHRSAALEVVSALASAVAFDACSTLIETFLRPLPEMVSPLDRVHCSLNINTETGRLSSRRPNLQNQPALEKDVYKIRQAFRAGKGNTLIVADYGQLELRVLAHVSNCKSMIKAFIDGGDFHSRTAINMFVHVKNAVDRGAVLLEKGTGANANLPLLKDVFASERRKAKTLNFSIAYGKTAFGLAKDWGVTKQEAEDILELWYRDRPEVRAWQERVKAEAMRAPLSEVYTLIGRTRCLQGLKENKFSKAFNGASRMAVNTPIQGAPAPSRKWCNDVWYLYCQHNWRRVSFITSC